MIPSEMFSLVAPNGAPIPVKGVKANITIDGLTATTTLTQTFANIEATPIEAVYTFPLALEATLLELSLAIGERLLHAQVFSLNQARDAYEKGMEQGRNT